MVASSDNVIELAWPKPEVQAEWRILAQSISDAAYLSNLSPNRQIQSFQIATEHGVGPLVYDHLKKAGTLDALTGELAEKFRRSYLQTSASNLILSSQVPSLAEAFDKEGLSVLWVKGISLAESVYPDPGLRPIGDIDIVVHKDDLDRGKLVLESLGFQQMMPDAFGKSDREINHVCAYRQPGNKGFPIELHHALVKGIVRKSSEGSTWLWKYNDPMYVRGHQVLTLKPEANVLYLCLHLSCHHGWKPRFIWLYDIYALLKKSKDTFDWKVFSSLAKELECESHVYSVLKAVKTFLSSPIPDDSIGESQREDQRSSVLHWQSNLPATRVILTLAELGRMANFRTQMWFLVRSLFPTRSYMQARYQTTYGRLWPVGYLRRWGIAVSDAMQTMRLLLKKLVREAVE